MTSSSTSALMTRLCVNVVALGIGLSMAAVAAFAAPPQGAADLRPMPRFAVPMRVPSPNSGAVRHWSTGQVRMSQDRTDDAYLLTIDLNGMAPENVQVRPLGRSLLVRARRDARTHRTETFGDGRGYRESYQVSTGSSTRRLPVPPDGDLAGLTREDGAEQVRIMIPRRSAPNWR